MRPLALVVALLVASCQAAAVTSPAQRIGAGTSYQPATLQVSTITAAPNGGWTGIPDDKVVRVGDRVFLGWVDGTSGANEYAQFDLTTGTLSTPQVLGSGLADAGPSDNHNSGSILVRSSDQRLIAAYAGHYDTTPRVRISTNPLDATAWGPEISSFTGSAFAITYCSLVQLDDGSIYLFTRSQPGGGTNTGRLVYWTSTDGGATWSGSMTILVTGASGKFPYWRIGSNGTRIDFFITDDHPGNGSSLYHFYMTSSGRFKSDGTSIATTLPITVADMTLVKSNAEGSVFPMGMGWDGAPYGLFQVNLSGTDTSTRMARWRSGSWQLNTIASAGGTLAGNVFAPGAAVSKTNPDIVYVSRKVGAKFEMHRYVSGDDGASWTGTALTTASASDNVWPDSVRDGGTRLEAMWLYGTYTSDTAFSFGIRGAGFR